MSDKALTTERNISDPFIIHFPWTDRNRLKNAENETIETKIANPNKSLWSNISRVKRMNCTWRIDREKRKQQIEISRFVGLQDRNTGLVPVWHVCSYFMLN